MADAKPYETLDMDQSIVDERGNPTSYFEGYDYSGRVLIYSGAPENNVSATPGTLCMDATGAAGSILYIKKTGTGNTGWVNVNA